MSFGKPHIECDRFVFFDSPTISPYIQLVKKTATKTGKTKFKRKEKTNDVRRNANGKIAKRLAKRFLAITFFILSITQPFVYLFFN